METAQQNRFRTYFRVLCVVVLCSCNERSDMDTTCELFGEKVVECWEAELETYINENGGIWNPVEYKKWMAAQCELDDFPPDFTKCFFEHTCDELSPNVLTDGTICDYLLSGDSSVDTQGGDVCYTGVVVGSDEDASTTAGSFSTFDEVNGFVLSSVAVELKSDIDEVVTYMLTDENGLYGENSGMEPFCSPSFFETMTITFTKDGCEPASYQTSLTTGVDSKAPGDGKNVVLNASLSCSAD